MFKTLLRDFLILFGLVTLALCTSTKFTKYIVHARDNYKWWGLNQMRGGNLAGISYMAFLKKFNSTPDDRVKRPAYNGSRNEVLYLHGDSYTWSLCDTNFAALDFHFINRYNGGTYHLDTSKKNILIIAITEIWFRRYFSDLRMLRDVYDAADKPLSTYKPHMPQKQDSATAAYASLLPWFSIDDLFNKNINQCLECNLFNYNFMKPMFEYKSAFNFYVFGRASGDVAVSKDRNFLFLSKSVSFTDTGSSYVPLYPGETDNLIANLNTIYDHYRAQGFKEIYLSVIPNTASLMQPEGYNNLIPTIQHDARLKMKIIDVYYTFKASPHLLFYRGDGHWNLEGKQMWVDMVNNILIKDNN